ncbi:hypothetical protein [Chryseobacterium herbae]|uniref:DUF1828 domain-containing protein n=1 Tax=Chryseobacterium herbae TaxID=2976476 RepID=A0ABT2IQ40_9FLAO|nr:hypothetical protein [Chryseobacterium sp. pc1-10]MCT2560929.1 hypothetical protein [Chryseobacterium sp. pc1-10]
MKKKLRHITIDGTIYRYVVKGWCIKFFGKDSSQFVKVDFFTKDEEYATVLMFTGSFKTFDNEQLVYLNINQPGFVRKVISLFNIAEFDFNIQRQYTITEACKMLEVMGYTIKKESYFTK